MDITQKIDKYKDGARIGYFIVQTMIEYIYYELAFKLHQEITNTASG